MASTYKDESENAVKDEIKGWLDAHRWEHWHIMQGKWAKKGLPDRIAIKDGTVLFIEAKRRKGGAQRPEQKEFMDKIKAQKGHYILARGCDDIESYLTSIGRKP